MFNKILLLLHRPHICRTNIKKFLILFQGPRINTEFISEQHQKRPDF